MVPGKRCPQVAAAPNTKLKQGAGNSLLLLLEKGTASSQDGFVTNVHPFLIRGLQKRYSSAPAEGVCTEPQAPGGYKDDTFVFHS